MTKYRKNQPKVAAEAIVAATAKTGQSKKENMLDLLRREGGATLDEIGNLTGWQAHSTRAVFTGLRKKGFTLERTRTDGVTHYAVIAEPAV